MQKNFTVNIMSNDFETLFAQVNHQTSLQVELELAGKKYKCIRVLRALSHKRLVIEATHGEQRVVIKLFKQRFFKNNHVNAELSAVNVLNEGKIATPLLLEHFSTGNCGVLIYDYLTSSKTVTEATLNPQKVITFIVDLHNKGIYQSDFHFHNLLEQDGDYFLIDMGSVKFNSQQQPLSKKISLLNLAMFIAQFNVETQKIMIEMFASYSQLRGWGDYSQQLFLDKYLAKARKKRQDIIFEKCFRNCSMTVYKQTFSQVYALSKPELIDNPILFINDIDALIENGVILKNGNSSTVSRVQYAGLDLVIKRYNLKSFTHFIRRAFRATRAANSWKYARWLDMLAINTPKPVLFLEQRYGFLRGKSYYVSIYDGGEDLISRFNHQVPTENQLKQISKLLSAMHDHKIVHGDMKATNLMINAEDEIALIDLDAMRCVSNVDTFNKLHKKDKKRFLQNWSAHPVLERIKRALSV
jgi:tRNA A-37 threonylcarbamoyl transferase component Bud32